MTNEDSAETRLSKFSNADRRAYQKPQGDREMEQPAPPLPFGDDPPLADLLEHAMREQVPLPGFTASVKPQRAPEPDGLPERLIEELQTAQEQIWAEPPPEYRHSLEEPAAPGFEALEQGPPAMSQAIAVVNRRRRGAGAAFRKIGQTLKGPAAARFKKSSRELGDMLAKGAGAAVRTSGKISRRMRIRDWRRRRLALLSVVHRQVFDRKTEKLLFCKSPSLEVYHVEETEAGLEKSFVYQGPIPKKLLDWALSALPEDLKRYAFVDFRAGNGRTLLLAARHNFEYAAGYAFDAESSETLEMISRNIREPTSRAAM